MSAIAKYNGVNAFTAKPLGIDTREGNGLYTPNIIPQTNLYASYDPAHPDSYSGSGTSLFDLSGNSNTVTLYGGFESGYVQNGWFVNDAVNDYGYSSSITFTPTAFSMGAWVRLDNTITAASVLQGVLNPTTLALCNMTIRPGAGTPAPFFRYRLADGTNTGRNLDTSTLSLNTWYYTAATLDTNTDTMAMYLFDGTGLIETKSRTDNTADYITNPMNGPIVYGGDQFTSQLISIGEAHIYNGTALSQSVIENIYENTKKRYGY